MSTYGGTLPTPTAGPGPVGTTTLSLLLRLVRERIGVPLSDSFMTDDVLTDQINQALLTLDTEQRWPWMEVVANLNVPAGTQVAPVPSDWRATRALFNSSGNELALRSPTDILAVTSTGEPAGWSVIGPGIALAPIPSSDVVLTHYYYRQTQRLAVGTDVAGVPDQYIEAIVCKAAELLSAREDDQTARAAHGADYDKWVNRMRRDVRRSTGPVVPRVRPGWQGP
jgi:hypothetical protein